MNKSFQFLQGLDAAKLKVDSGIVLMPEIVGCT